MSQRISNHHFCSNVDRRRIINQFLYDSPFVLSRMCYHFDLPRITYNAWGWKYVRRKVNSNLLFVFNELKPESTLTDEFLKMWSWQTHFLITMPFRAFPARPFSVSLLPFRRWKFCIILLMINSVELQQLKAMSTSSVPPLKLWTFLSFPFCLHRSAMSTKQAPNFISGKKKSKSLLEFEAINLCETFCFTWQNFIKQEENCALSFNVWKYFPSHFLHQWWWQSNESSIMLMHNDNSRSRMSCLAEISTKS